MSRKNIILTLWLMAPLATFAGLYALIFITLDQDKPMSDARPIGAGAGDTGNANALGQWLAGRDPDAVSLATKAKRQRLMISPADWPGGIELRLPASALGGHEGAVYVTQILDEPGRYASVGMTLDEASGQYRAVFTNAQLGAGARFVVAPALPTRVGTGYTDGDGRALAVLTLGTLIPPSDAGVNDPLPVLVPIDSVYSDKQP